MNTSSSSLAPGSVIGIMGGGQLGRMTALAASNMGYRTHIFCPNVKSPAAQVSSQVTVAEYTDKSALRRFAENVDVVSFEFENVPNETVMFLEELVQVRPRWKVLHVAQNRIREKGFFRECEVPTVRYHHIKSYEDLVEGCGAIGGKTAILKTVELGYDGKGQEVISFDDDLKAIWDRGTVPEGILEEKIPFRTEISVVVARGLDTQTATYEPAENIHESGILDVSVVPANVPQRTLDKAREYAVKLANALKLVGLLAVEFFVLPNGELLANEIAPRPHNSGHWTMDGADTSQFEQLVRAICGLPLGSTRRHSDVRMKNLIGADIDDWREVLNDETAKLHLYGKVEARKGRKMGHVNYVMPLGTLLQEKPAQIMGEPW